MPLAPATRLGPYEIIGPLGEGGMGEVYRARDSRLARDVALKILPPAAATDPDPSTSSGSARAQSRADRLRRFEQEARAAASLNHPNILVVHDVALKGDYFRVGPGIPSPVDYESFPTARS